MREWELKGDTRGRHKARRLVRLVLSRRRSSHIISSRPLYRVLVASRLASTEPPPSREPPSICGAPHALCTAHANGNRQEAKGSDSLQVSTTTTTTTTLELSLARAQQDNFISRALSVSRFLTIIMIISSNFAHAQADLHNDSQPEGGNRLVPRGFAYKTGRREASTFSGGAGAH